MYGLCLVELGNLASPSFTPEWPRPPYPVAFPNALRSLVPIWIPLPPLVTPLVCRQSTTDRSNTRAYRNPHIFLSFSFSFSFSSRSFAKGFSQRALEVLRPLLFTRLETSSAPARSRPGGHPLPSRDPSSSHHARDPGKREEEGEVFDAQGAMMTRSNTRVEL